MGKDPTKRFTGRAQNYARYRPRYPQSVLSWLVKKWDLSPASVIADIGSGTGILSELFLKHGNRVFGVEPNTEMRHVAELQLREYANFVSIAGTAEATSLPDNSADIVTAGQAFHWFAMEETKTEFLRILKPDGLVVLLWNRAKNTGAPLGQAFAELVDKHALQPEAQQKPERPDKDPAIEEFFDGRVEKQLFDNSGSLDWESFRGGFLSASWAPLPGDEKFEGVIGDLRKIFEAFQTEGWLRNELKTELYAGRLPYPRRKSR
jgi:ubiquinone/menaquinone biosynthesis C-methylase UbiE